MADTLNSVTNSVTNGMYRSSLPYCSSLASHLSRGSALQPLSKKNSCAVRLIYVALHLLTSHVSEGPVADKVREQHQKTSDELSNLYASRQTPNNPTATGQPLTHYHSFFSELLSWNNPRT